MNDDEDDEDDEDDDGDDGDCENENYDWRLNMMIDGLWFDDCDDDDDDDDEDDDDDYDDDWWLMIDYLWLTVDGWRFMVMIVRKMRCRRMMLWKMGYDPNPARVREESVESEGPWGPWKSPCGVGLCCPCSPFGLHWLWQRDTKEECNVVEMVWLYSFHVMLS